MASSIDDLMDQARRTADETQAIDEAFQERVRRNYEMLSEAVRLMGSVATSATLSPPPMRERPVRVAPPAPEAPAPAPVVEPPAVVEAPVAKAPEPEDPGGSGGRHADRSRGRRAGAEPAGSARRAAQRKAGQEPRARPVAADAHGDGFGIHQRLRTGRRPCRGAGQRGWTWKDLLSSIDETESQAALEPGPEPVPEVEPARPAPQLPLEEVLAAEIGAMGIDPTALLPRSRVHEIAATLQARDVNGAREVVRKLAPAATRRLARRLFADDVLKKQVMTYLGRYGALLEEAAERDGEACCWNPC